MTSDGNGKRGTGITQAEARKARLAEELRGNLKKRKAQARLRQAGGDGADREGPDGRDDSRIAGPHRSE